ncbi:MAG: serine--tRNA ligase [Firmicutes bacterium]|nr:serine--tRNA ligase [Bacillota bacterium]
MFDAKLLRNNPDIVKKALTRRGMDTSIVDNFIQQDIKHRELIVKIDDLRNKRNVVSKEIGIKKQKGGDISAEAEEMRRVGDGIKSLDEELEKTGKALNDILISIPNIPHESVPDGPDDSFNVEIKKWGALPEFDFEPKAHWDIAAELDIVDFERAVKISGARFVIMKGAGALLERALINFMLDVHTREHGYKEVLPPYLVNSASMFATGQLPKFEEDLFKCRDTDYYLIPTSEVPLVNLHRNEILEGDVLPLYYTGFSACFRSEAGAAGKDTRGLTRVHQFDKVELIKFTRPEESYAELEKLLANAEEILRRLKIPYRVTAICVGDLGFTASKKYDIEFWAPGQKKFVEISSCSNCTDFQARRAGIRYRPQPKAKPEFLNTLNGSGVAVGRTVAAILENYQQKDGSVVIPEVLHHYTGGLKLITK